MRYPDRKPNDAAIIEAMDAERTIPILFHRIAVYSWSELLRADEDDVQRELEWSRARKGVVERLKEIAAGNDEFHDHPNSFLESITTDERRTVKILWDRFPSDAIDTKNRPEASHHPSALV